MAVHWLCTLAITLAVLGGVGVAALLLWWRFAGTVGPGLVHCAVGGCRRFQWRPECDCRSVPRRWHGRGSREGVDRPLDLRLTDVTVTDQSGGRRLNIPRAEVSLSFYELLFGRVVPRAVELDEPQLTLVRANDGRLNLGLGNLADSGEPVRGGTPLADLLAELARPAGSDRALRANALLGQRAPRCASMMGRSR